MGKPRTKAEKFDETRGQLLAAARTLFGKRGYAETGTEDLVAHAAVTRGALYYHFSDKAALFDALVEEIGREILAAVENAAATKTTKLEGLVAGCRAYLDTCLAPDIRRIYIVDAASVLGVARLRDIDARHARGSLREGVQEVLVETRAKGISGDALTALLSGALDEAVLWLVQNDNPPSRRQLDATLTAMIRRLFAPA